MQLTSAIYRNGFLFFIAFAALVVWGFWPSFYGHPLSLKTNVHYIHAIVLSLWCLLLIVQPLLIRLNLRQLHRVLGKTSFAIVPFILITGLILLQQRQHAMTEVGDFEYGFLFLIMESPFLFLLLYGLAIYHRKDSTLHARWMICTVFPLLSGATDRLIGRSFPNNALQAMYTGWFMADLVLLALAIWDWRSHKKLNVFPWALALMIYHHTSWYFVGQLPLWHQFADWFAAF